MSLRVILSVSKDKYEERPDVIERAVRGAVDLRNDRRAKEANECLNVVPESEEIREAMKETRESAPGVGWSENRIHQEGM